MMSILRSGAAATLFGLILLSVAIWFFAPYVSFGSWSPLQGVAARLILIAVIFSIWGAVILLKKRKATKANEKLAGDLLNAGDDGGIAEMSSDEIALLNQRFEDAITTLRETSGKKGSFSLYELPWFVIIGPPGSGKTTALVNSGLKFPLEQRFGKEALRGVGGTRNCDWWFTDEAVLLDTAGRYVTQDSHQAVDSAAWAGFLDLLKKYRKRRPINGVLVAVSLSDLMTQSQAERNAQVVAIRQRIQELYKHFGIRFPVYMIFTKCDLLAGFIEFFDDLDHDNRQQVWGTTFQYREKKKGDDDDIAGYSAQLELLLERLTDRVMWRMSQERDHYRRSKIYNFPQQLITLRATLESFLNDLFSGSRFDEAVLLRGVYFTSGVQEGAPIDRMMSVMAKTFGVAQQALPSFGGKGRSYFITQLLRDIVFQESGLAGVNPRIEKRRQLIQATAYVGAIVFATVAAAAWITSFSVNRSYLGEVSEALDLYTKLPSQESGGRQTVDDVLPRLDILRNVLDVAQQHEDAVPLHMGIGLYQGDSMSQRISDAYRRELNESLGPAVMSILETRIRENASNPELLYEYLKAYMMLGNPERMESRQLAFIIDAEWKRSFANDSDTYQRLKKHSDFLFEQPMPYSVNAQLISGAQATLALAPLSDLLYSRLKLDVLAHEQDDLALSAQLGLAIEKVYRRKSGLPLSEPIPVLYTKKGFTELYPTLSKKIIVEAGKENWVLGKDEGGASVQEFAEVESDLLAKYTADYIATWRDILDDLEIVPLQDHAQAMETLDSIAVMKELLLVVANNTNLSTPKQEDDEGKEEGERSRLDRLLGGQEAVSSLVVANPGDPITKEFSELNRLVEGEPKGIDSLLSLVSELQREVEETSAGGGTLTGLAGGGGPAARSLQTAARRQPEPVSSWLNTLGGGSQKLVVGSAKSELSSNFDNSVEAVCKQLISGRYPFDRNSQDDVAVDDFGRVFGYQGVLDTFFEENLAPVVDRSASTWKMRSGSALTISTSALRQFQLAQRIREAYFRSGGQKPDVAFRVTPTSLDTEVQRFVFEASGQSLSYDHGPPRPTLINWPGNGMGNARAAFEEAGGGGPTVVKSGPWALFRLLDSSDVRKLSDIKYEAVVTAGVHSATLEIEMQSVINPLSGPKLHEFRCPDQL